MTTCAVHPDLRTIADAAWIAAPDRYVIGGEERRIAEQSENVQAVSATAAPPQAILLRMVENELYYRLYRQPCEPAATDPVTAEVDTMRDYSAALSVANCGSGTWDPGWLVTAVAADGHVLLRRDDVTYRATQAQVRSDEGDADASLRIGMRARVRVPKEIRQLVQGFYMALGNAPWPDAADTGGRIVRFYWSLSAAVAPLYLRQITGALNEAGVPFRTKVVHDPTHYRNADAGVLYVPTRVLDRVWFAIEATYAVIRTGLRPSVPMFTYRLAAGLGLAEDPGGGISFGQSRCRVAASGLWSAFAAGAHDAPRRLDHIAAAFLQNDIDPARPHRRRNSTFAERAFEEPALASGSGLASQATSADS
jgi:hypothetical protein